MDNEIKIILTGSMANDYVRNVNLQESRIEKLLKELDEKSKECEKLSYDLEQLRGNTSPYSLAKESNIRLEHDAKLMDDSSFKEPSKPTFTKTNHTPITEENELDEDWKFFIGTTVPSGEIMRDAWDDRDSAIVENAIDKTNRDLYSVRILALYLNRSESAIRSRAIKLYDAHIRNGMIISELP